MSFRRPLIALAAAMGLVATSCGGGTSEPAVVASSAPAAEVEQPVEAAPAAPAEPAEDALVASTVAGGQIDFGSLEGQDVVLWFWAPW